MKLADIKTADDAARAIAETKAALSTLQGEQDDAKWLASEADRNRLERDLRALEQLQTRCREREEKARTADLERVVAEQRAIVTAPSAVFDTLLEHVVSSATRTAELYADDRTRSAAHYAMSQAEVQLGREPRDPPLQFFPTLQRIREATWLALEKRQLVDAGHQLSSVYQPSVPTPQATEARKSGEASWQNIPRREPGQYRDAFDGVDG